MVFFDACRCVRRFRELPNLIPFAFLALALAMPAEAAAVGRGEGRDQLALDAADSTTLLGSYLAGRIARVSRDSESAAYFYKRVLERDPTNLEILDDAFQLELAAGNFNEARQFAIRLLKHQKDNTIAHIFLGLEAFKHKDYTLAAEHFKSAEKEAPGEPTLKMAQAWTLVAEGRTEAALALLSTPSKAAWASHFETVQRAFIADVGKKRAEAEKAYQSIYDAKAPNTRIAEGYARHLAHIGDKAGALKIIEESKGQSAPMIKKLVEELASDKTPRLMVSTVDEGLSEVFLGIGQVLSSNNGVDAAQIYLRLALYLNPKSDIILLEFAELYGEMEQYEKANALLDTIPDSSPFLLNVQIRKALNLNALEKPDEAIALLRELMKKMPDNEQIPQTIASLESARKNYDAALPYYDQAIGMIKTVEKKNWSLFYARGIAYERTKQWAKAEPDFKKALELDPEQGPVLNYLGYSWIDQNLNIAEAFELIKKAVRLRPNDGYIVDSLGWAYYVQKDYEQASKYLERAVELRPDDPTLNDHLGDVYWRVGRKLEAQFQWSQALTLNPEPDDAVKIKRKIEQGGLQDDALATTGPTKAAASPAAIAQPATTPSSATTQ